MDIACNIKQLKAEIPSGVKLVAVSKTQPVEAITEAYKNGQKIFGENKVQELTAKYEQLSGLDIEWHLIGHLQTNKVKYIAPFVDMIQSVDSLKLLAEINKYAEKNSRIINCLLQFHIAMEETKYGLDYDEAAKIIESEEYKSFRNINICGVMGIASFVEDDEKIKKEFKILKNYFTELKNNFFQGNNNFSEISMGMSGDWKLAIEEGSTIIRIGTAIFGNRNYNNQNKTLFV
ncbi:MAG: YggS family pyridoxal phosphate-dependent enzyme [Bacteroidales bacterium]|jgi:pyridoxal phosphate enzyme (YggS family)|nr:YggS family pyridoxal phosphate-dependent enzyme [Bacteroidales bacterium]